MPSIEINEQFEQVLNFINRTNQNVFLTGKAGTGKTTLLKHIRQNTFKQIAVLAPTGVAAINAGGSTIHSFFQFPFTPFLPVWKENGMPDFSATNLPTSKFNSQRLAIFKNLELLVIDEVSMVRADLLDQVDFTLRQTRKRWHLPFGGVQVLLIGDMYQLPPIVQHEEKKLLEEVYSGFYFFDSFVIRNHPPVFIELTKIYRQSEQTFVSLLNKVRHNQLDEKGLELLNSRYNPNLSSIDYSNHITLTTHNKKADEINARNLDKLPGNNFSYKCKVEGLFSEKNYPVDEELILKVGTKVMFLKNNNEKNYYNGKIGLVTHLSKDKIEVTCEEDKTEIEVEKEQWTNVAYNVDKSTKHINEQVLGTFWHFPLRLAWAITIHKSQGLTFDKLIIDAAEAFSVGQVYVALSRCRSFEGLTLSTKIDKSALINDANVIQFSSNKPDENQVSNIYKTAQQQFMRTVLLELFDFSEQLRHLSDIAAVIQVSKTRLQAGLDWFTKFSDYVNLLNDVGSKFRNQLNSLLDRASQIETDETLQARIKAASVYFEIEIGKNILALKNCTLVTESKETATELNYYLQNLLEDLHLKNCLIKNCIKGFYLSDYLRQKLDVVYPNIKINTYASAKNTKISVDVSHPQLFKRLMLVRDEICNDEMKPIYMVANNKTLIELTNYLPDKPGHLLQIAGFGKAKADAYGDKFLAIIKDFMAEHNLLSNMDAKAPKKQKKKAKEEITGDEFLKGKGTKVSTKEQTYNLFKSGFTLKEIAEQRGFALSTVEGHLTPYIAKGEIDINKLVSEEKQKQIIKALEGFDEATGLTPVKTKLPDTISFSEIRFVLAHKKRKLIMNNEN